MNCSELIADIISIKAYDFKDVSLALPYTHDMTVKASSVIFSGLPVILSLKENSGEARCVLSSSEAGDIYQNSLSWQTDDTEPETLRQISALTTGRTHYLITTYAGTRKLLYNWCGIGRIRLEASLSGSSETIGASFSVNSRFPILTLL
mgnify:FL=1